MCTEKIKGTSKNSKLVILIISGAKAPSVREWQKSLRDAKKLRDGELKDILSMNEDAFSF